MNTSVVYCNDLDALSNLYESVKYRRSYELINDSEQQEAKSSVEEINISIITPEGSSEVIYKGDVDQKPSPNTFICVDQVNDVTIYVTLMSDKMDRVKVTIYDDQQNVVDDFVSSIVYVDTLETELNIVKQELVS